MVGSPSYRWQSEGKYFGLQLKTSLFSNLRILISSYGKKSRKKILIDFMNSGFEATVVSADSNLFDKEWIGNDKE
jgi:diphthamide synthase (EF-2-diphthine--ammonia ligase)